MLSKQGYIEGLGYMLAWYVNFQFRLYDIKKDKYGNEVDDSRVPSMQYKVWYEAFKEFSDEDFGSVVKSYCSNEIYPPSSPASILTYAKALMLEKRYEEIDGAWLELLKFIEVYGFNDIPKFGNGSRESVRASTQKRTQINSSIKFTSKTSRVSEKLNVEN